MLCLALAPGLHAQTQQPEAVLALAETLLAQLDGLAETCQQALANNADQGPPCRAFLDAVDGELVADYLGACERATRWREAYVSDPDASDASAEINLQRMIRVQSLCGESALAQSTQAVLPTFAALQANEFARIDALQGASGAATNSLQIQRAEQQRALQQQQQRLRTQTQQQWQQIELELIRQQLRRLP